MKPGWLASWHGATVVCIASGPSLTAADCDAVRGLPAIVTNNTWRLCPWADALLAYDGRWWDHYRDELEAFAGLRLTCAPANRRRPGVHSLIQLFGYRTFGNSGAAAVSLAALAGASRVVLLGYDCQAGPQGQKHWHADHPEPLTNAKSLAAWPARFAQVAAYAKGRGCEVVNATRSTALSCFPRVELEDVLEASEPMKVD